MFVVRESFVAKPGMASKLAALMKQVFTVIPGQKYRVMTDIVGDFNTVVIESEANDFAEFEKRMKEYSERPEFREQMKGYTDLYITGRREVFRVV